MADTFSKMKRILYSDWLPEHTQCIGYLPVYWTNSSLLARSKQCYLYLRSCSLHHSIVPRRCLRPRRCGCVVTIIKGSFSIDDSDGAKNVLFMMNSRCFKLCRVYSNSLKMSNVPRQISLELITWAPHSSLDREKNIRHRLFTSSIKFAIRHFHVIIVQGRQRNVQKSVMHVQSCCFAQQTYCFFEVAVVVAKTP